MDVRVWLRENWERSLGVVCLAAGAVATICAFLGVRSSRFLTEDLSYLISGGVGGLLLIGVGATLLVTAHLHVMRRDLLRAADVVRSPEERPVVDLLDAAPAESSPPGSDDVSPPGGGAGEDEPVSVVPVPARSSTH
jgi:hypothetical protein